jgi:hypothetical protein
MAGDVIDDPIYPEASGKEVKEVLTAAFDSARVIFTDGSEFTFGLKDEPLIYIKEK